MTGRGGVFLETLVVSQTQVRFHLPLICTLKIVKQEQSAPGFGSSSCRTVAATSGSTETLIVNNANALANIAEGGAAATAAAVPELDHMGAPHSAFDPSSDVSWDGRRHWWWASNLYPHCLVVTVTPWKPCLANASRCCLGCSPATLLPARQPSASPIRGDSNASQTNKLSRVQEHLRGQHLYEFKNLPDAVLRTC